MWRLQRSDGGARAFVLIHERIIHVWIGARHQVFKRQTADAAGLAGQTAAGSLTAVLPGVVVSVLDAPGQAVSAGQPLLVVEAMKMEHTIRAPEAGTVKAVRFAVGQRVQEGSTLVELGPVAAAADRDAS